MQRSVYFNYIEDKLSILATRINNRGRLNILDFHNHSENFYAHFMNELFEWQLINKNLDVQNVEAIDLVDDTAKIVIQVSSTATKTKIQSALSKKFSNYSGYRFKFISISKNATKLRKLKYTIPTGIVFNPVSDIYDNAGILSLISSFSISKQKEIWDFIKLELGNEPDTKKVESNLAKIINILALEDWNNSGGHYQTIPYDINKKIKYNSLKSASKTIESYALHFNRIDNIYKEFDAIGNNKSHSVLKAINRFYIKAIELFSGDNLFFHIVNRVIQLIQESSNYEAIAVEELELCVDIIVVDAFIRCKIFENPEGYNYAPA